VKAIWTENSWTLLFKLCRSVICRRRLYRYLLSGFLNFDSKLTFFSENLSNYCFHDIGIIQLMVGLFSSVCLMSLKWTIHTFRSFYRRMWSSFVSFFFGAGPFLDSNGHWWSCMYVLFLENPSSRSRTDVTDDAALCYNSYIWLAQHLFAQMRLSVAFCLAYLHDCIATRYPYS